MHRLWTWSATMSMKCAVLYKSSFKCKKPILKFSQNVQYFPGKSPGFPLSILGQHVVKSAVLQSQTTSFIPERIIKRNYVSKKNYTFSELKEEELEETFVRGGGPGGQSVNQTANCVVLKHKPSGIVIKCHETRSQLINRQRARERLQEKLDFYLHGSSSFLSLQEQESSFRRKNKKKRNKSRLELKKAFKEREGVD